MRTPQRVRVVLILEYSETIHTATGDTNQKQYEYIRGMYEVLSYQLRQSTSYPHVLLTACSPRGSTAAASTFAQREDRARFRIQRIALKTTIPSATPPARHQYAPSRASQEQGGIEYNNTVGHTAVSLPTSYVRVLVYEYVRV